ncbi:hypothetical protein C8R45DRAFT_1022526 [Mycena sanguinolenta]|nr:hypothetical protein C8R45DRAFT_1022526 [Mycena sanguinolenta]
MTTSRGRGLGSLKLADPHPALSSWILRPILFKFSFLFHSIAFMFVDGNARVFLIPNLMLEHLCSLLYVTQLAWIFWSTVKTEANEKGASYLRWHATVPAHRYGNYLGVAVTRIWRVDCF